MSKKNWIVIMVLTLILVSVSSLYLSIENKKEKMEAQNLMNEIYLKNQAESFMVIHEYKTLAESYFDWFLSSEENLEILESAYGQDDLIQAKKRLELKENIKLLGKQIEKNGFENLTLRFPNGKPFLCVSEACDYTKLFETSNTMVEKVNEYKILKYGFNQSETFQGYSYIFPIHHGASYIGSIELQISREAMIAKMDHFIDGYGQLILNKQNELINESLLENFKITEFSGAYYENEEINKKLNRYKNIAIEDEIGLIKKNIGGEIAGKLSLNKNFIEKVKIDDQIYLVTFLAMNNEEGLNLGYYNVYEENIPLENLEENYDRQRILIIAIWLVLYSLILYLINSKNKSEKKAGRDALTGLYNRGKFLGILKKEQYRTKRYLRDLSIVMVDIDYFKRINDQHGHHIGDIVIKEFSQKLIENVRASDAVVRWGGEEFLILLPETNAPDAYIWAENLRKIIEKANFIGDIKMTASFGVHFISANESTEEIIVKVDKVLYESKESGRNKVAMI